LRNICVASEIETMINEDKDSVDNSFFSMVTGKEETGISNTKKNSETALSAEYPDRSDGSLPAETSLPADSSVAEENVLSAEGSDMPHGARRVLVHLMRQGVVISSQKPKLFELVCRYETFVRRHLSEVYLQLVLDQKSGVAFVATKTSEHGDAAGANGFSDEGDDGSVEDFSTLISKRTLSLYDTLILLVLRKHYQDRESSGEQKITIDIERLESYLTPFLPITDHASKDRKKLQARVKEMVKRKVLSTIRGAEDRYEITPVIRYVVSASFLESMLAEYTKLASDQAGESSDTNNHVQDPVELNTQEGEHQ
jgi:hypothetical protein